MQNPFLSGYSQLNLPPAIFEASNGNTERSDPLRCPPKTRTSAISTLPSSVSQCHDLLRCFLESNLQAEKATYLQLRLRFFPCLKFDLPRSFLHSCVFFSRCFGKCQHVSPKKMVSLGVIFQISWSKTKNVKHE